MKTAIGYKKTSSKFACQPGRSGMSSRRPKNVRYFRMGARLLSMVVFLCVFVSLSADVCAVAATWHSAGGSFGTNGFRVFAAEMHL